MKKYLILFLILFTIPSIAMASWWNPFSWSKNPKQTTEIIEPTPIQPTDKPISIPETTPKQTTEPRVIERIVEKPVIQTITVQDPALQTKINTLVAENEALKTQVDRLLKSNKSLNDEVLACEDKPTTTFSADDQCEYATETLNDIQNQYTEIGKEQEKIRKEDPKNYLKNSDYLDLMLKRKPLPARIQSAKSAIALYCN